MSNPLLTISLIVKNEGNHLKRCLDSLNSLRENIQCELIITDTGSTDNTVEIAESYADKVLHFTWNDDFAAARNFGLEQANGKWFLFIDADEWFENTDEIETFLKSKDSIKFKSVYYTIRNYTEADGSSYSDAKILRLFQRGKNRYFQGNIHEYIEPVEPIMLLNDIAHHYGYIMEDPILKKEKHERNLRPLLAEYKKNPNDLRTIQLLINQYDFIEDFETAVLYCKEGLLKERKNPDFRYRSIFYRLLAQIYFIQEKHKELIALINEYFQLRKIDGLSKSATDMTMYLMSGMMEMRENDWTKSINQFKTFIELYELYEAGQLNTPEIIINPVSVATPKNYSAALYNIAACFGKLGKYEDALNTISSIPKELQNDEHDKYMKTFTLGEELKEKSDQIRARTEFEMLGDKIKEQIHIFIEKGDLTNAAAIIQQYEKICPQDPELNTLKKKANLLN